MLLAATKITKPHLVPDSGVLACVVPFAPPFGVYVTLSAIPYPCSGSAVAVRVLIDAHALIARSSIFVARSAAWLGWARREQPVFSVVGLEVRGASSHGRL